MSFFLLFFYFFIFLFLNKHTNPSVIQFHRQEYTVKQVKEFLAGRGLLVRDVEEDDL